MSYPASIKCPLRKPLCRLLGSEPFPYEGGGASLPLIVENSRFLIGDKRIELVGLDGGTSNQ
ncbi:hypothetical protein DC522_29755 [Microvirga sp. KLBC 81]|nr:hypothetical protein DC522_29755 [Microvirga sp. KLBC 81]